MAFNLGDYYYQLDKNPQRSLTSPYKRSDLFWTFPCHIFGRFSLMEIFSLIVFDIFSLMVTFSALCYLFFPPSTLRTYQPYVPARFKSFNSFFNQIISLKSLSSAILCNAIIACSIKLSTQTVLLFPGLRDALKICPKQ